MTGWGIQVKIRIINVIRRGGGKSPSRSVAPISAGFQIINKILQREKLQILTRERIFRIFPAQEDVSIKENVFKVGAQ